MNISLNQLKALSSIAHFQSITKAAKALNMTQPAVSVQLKNLQENFDVPLTEIIGKKIHITEFGQELVDMSERIFAEMDQIEQRMMELKGLLAGKIRISAVSTGKYIIPYLMADFMKIHPHVEINLEVSNRFKVLAHLEENSTDLALVSIAPDEMNLESIVIAENKWYLACSPKKAEEYQKLISENKWDKIPFILRESGSGTRVMMEKFFHDRDINTNSKMELATNEAVKQAIMAGLGASILSSYSMVNEIKEKRIHILKFEGLPIIADWKLVWLKQKKHAPAVKAFIRWVSENKRKIFQDHFEQLNELD
ncbi:MULTISPECIES: LysR family transcriptional regulator [unclassified Algoriphagus]|jgi:DNA-binding transcriptional LysR family regulator|uniref:LysR family transcriptional regulator n=1 Tax=unclassified Algoriphagus TaxID=2641541 RepID=UPI000C648030|nr:MULTISPECIES: LysR family transcriptional regulator [unclassified Algoriphagus]MAL15070.1 LysR family transcriptional regulator [Algoriphagus sp.]HAD51500.1 LysR family transcriptional regulator [Algoriphagus sp.]HAH36844.1 LysR family transcriptional regulator [Algoriphagus sp.]HAS59518.1 LysR family transcriptional regulator [Algoriphagus sp.]HCB47744.1 LysR family transcriptional regulator [Algoriphagus sp.]|tara:strand:- start:2160 stop:3089 length:930 start_codon:yes stop_codon:yes gene_type:complete